jgi:hypothetical protein
MLANYNIDTFIKGFMLDDEKIRSHVTKHEGDTGPNWEINWYQPIINCIPRSAYTEVGAGFNANGNVIAVIVLEEGRKKEELEKKPVHTDNEKAPRRCFLKWPRS